MIFPRIPNISPIIAPIAPATKPKIVPIILNTNPISEAIKPMVFPINPIVLPIIRRNNLMINRIIVKHCGCMSFSFNSPLISPNKSFTSMFFISSLNSDISIA